MNLQCKSLKIADPHPVKTWAKDPKSQKAVQEELPVLLPHVQFSQLSQEYPEGFGTIFATSECQAFWQGVEKAKDPRLVKPIGSNGKAHAPLYHTQGIFCQVPYKEPTLSSSSFLSRGIASCVWFFFVKAKLLGFMEWVARLLSRHVVAALFPSSFVKTRGGGLRDKVCVCNLFLGGFAASFVGQLVQLLALFFDLLNQKPSFHQ